MMGKSTLTLPWTKVGVAVVALMAVCVATFFLLHHCRSDRTPVLASEPVTIMVSGGGAVDFGEEVSFVVTMAPTVGAAISVGGEGDVRREMVIVDAEAGKQVPYAGRRRDLLPDSVHYVGKRLEIGYLGLLPLPGVHTFRFRVPLSNGGVLESPPVTVNVRAPLSRQAEIEAMQQVLVGGTGPRNVGPGDCDWGPPAPGLKEVCFARPGSASAAIGELLAARARNPHTPGDWRRMVVLVRLLGDLADPEQAAAHGVERTALPGTTFMDILEKEHTPAVVVALLDILPAYAPELAAPEVHGRLVRELRRRRESFYDIAFAAYAALLDPRLVKPEETADLDLLTEIENHPQLTLRQKQELQDMAAVASR